MIIIAHRRNTKADLLSTPRHLGVEIDVRSSRDALYLHHDPFIPGEDLQDWLEAYDHRLLILNVKEEGLEERLLQQMAERGIEDFFFLDQTFPSLVKIANAGERRCAVRLSEYESVETVMALAGRVEWVWADCFTRLALTRRTEEMLHDAGFKICLVSPELQGRTTPSAIDALRLELQQAGITVDAVCTKRVELWS